VTDRHIVAMGGAPFDPGDGLFRTIFEISGASRPRVCYVPTAVGDDAWYLARFYGAFPASSFVPSHLPLFDRTDAHPRERLLEQDVILVGGGNTANLLAIWRLHGVDDALREAWERGIVLCGSSAGANCWFEASTTDSFGPTLRPLGDGLGFLGGSFCPHYDGEPQRRPLYRRLVAEGFPAGYAADDFAGAHFVGNDLERVISSREGANVYRVERVEDGDAVETPLG
jgi:dipeptidase E